MKVGATPALQAEAAMAATSSGPIIGTRQDDMVVFLGVPYAAAPIGALRFSPPQRPASWREPRLTQHFGAACPQTATLGTPSTDEDCLTLNIYVPAMSASPRPVLVFFYGGSFHYGDAAVAANGQGPDYRGEAIARRTGAIVITVNYRLGALGFLAAAALDKENVDHVSGNYGLLDQQAALRWIKANAAAFGGESRQITVFGQSAGAVSILEQMISPGAAGLFARAELESAGVPPASTLATEEQKDIGLIKAVGCDQASDVAVCLRAVPVSAFLQASGGSFGPNVDGVVLPFTPDQAFTSGAFAHVPVIMGSNLDEGTYFIAQSANAAGHAITGDEAIQKLVKAFGAQSAATVAARYGLPTASSPGQVLSSILTDEFFSCPSYRLRQTLAGWVPVSEYEFSQPHPVHNYPIVQAAGIDEGDAHTTELAYIFGHDGAGHALTGTDAGLSDQIIDGLGRYARYGQLPWLYAATATVASDGALGHGTAPVVALDTPIRITTSFYQRHQCGFWAGLGNPTALRP